MNIVTMHLICSIYRSSKKAETYLYVDKKQGVAAIPEALESLFGKPIHVMDMLLTPDRKLARVDVAKVREAIKEQGWFLQLPPPPDEDLYLAEGHQGAR